MTASAPRLQDRPVVWWLCGVFAVAGQFTDVVSTLAVLRAGGSEHNPLAAQLMRMGDWPLLISAKLALALALAVLLCAFAAWPTARRSWAGAVALLVGGVPALVFGFLGGWNGAIWLISAHLLPW